MSKAAKTLFGGTDRSAQRKTEGQNQRALESINLQGQNAQNYLGNALPEMQRLTGEGYQGAANMLTGAFPQQLAAMQQGNQAAQQYLLGGMPAFQNALMGNQFAPSPQMTPTQIQTDPSFMMNARVPMASQQPQQMPQQAPQNQYNAQHEGMRNALRKVIS